MLDKNDVIIAARGQWEFLLPLFGIDRTFLNNSHGPCPVCGGKDRFRFDNIDGRGTFFCNQCRAGDGFKLLMLKHGIRFGDALKQVAGALGISEPAEFRSDDIRRLIRDTKFELPRPDWQKYQAIVDWWNAGTPVTPDNPAGKYLLRARGISLTSFPEALRWHVQSGSMLAAFTDPACRLVQVERFYLQDSGEKRYIDGKCKLLMSSWCKGVMPSGAIKLYAPEDVLAIAEGVETALAFYAIHKIPVWAAQSAGLMHQVVIPESVQKVIILADNDESGTGELFANKLARVVCDKGKTAEVWLPPNVGQDFADIFAQKAG